MLAAETRRFSFGGISFLYLLCQTPANGASASCPAPGAGFSSTTFSSCADHALNVCCPPATARPSAAPLILLHGFAQSSASWDAVARKLAATGRPIYALDLVGHGESERPADACAYALDAQGEALLSFARMVADREGARPAVLGYSMGGRVTLAALRRDPRAFAAVVLEAAGFGPATQAERDAATESDAACAARLRADGLPFLTATHDADNPKSGAVMERIGMTYRYSYEELWQPKNRLVIFRMYQMDLNGTWPTYRAYWDCWPRHWV